MRKIIVHTVNGKYLKTVTDVDAAAATSKGVGVGALIEKLAEVIGSADTKDSTFKLNVDGVGWVAFNPRHVIAVEFHGTEDVE